jgi:hypothetical protein
MLAFTPEDVRKVNWTLRIGHLSHRPQMKMARHLYNLRSVEGFASDFDIPEFWAPVVHGLLYRATRLVPEIQFMGVGEKDGMLKINFLCDSKHRDIVDDLIIGARKKIDLLTTVRLEEAEEQGLL